MKKILKGRARQQFNQYPEAIDEATLVRCFTLTDTQFAWLKSRRGAHNKLGIALQWLWLEYLGWQPTTFTGSPNGVTRFVAQQLDIEPTVLVDYGQHETFWREHMREVRQAAKWREFNTAEREQVGEFILPQAIQNNDKTNLLRAMMDWCHREKVIRPGLTTLEELIRTIRGCRHIGTKKG
jgi:hypothetical protein